MPDPWVWLSVAEDVLVRLTIFLDFVVLPLLIAVERVRRRWSAAFGRRPRKGRARRVSSRRRS